MNIESLPIEPELLLEETTALLRQVIGTRVEVIDYAISNQKRDYLVIMVQLRHPSLNLVLKLAGPDASIPYPFEQTATLYHLLSTQTTIPIPDVIAVDSSYHTWPWRYLIRTAISGEEWAVIRPHLSAQELTDALAQIGDAVAQIHHIAFPAFGEIISDGRVQGGALYLQALREKAESIIKSHRLRTLFLSVMEENANLFVEVNEACLCHEDLHGHNLLFHRHQDGWQLATILDFDKAWAGYRETDLARMELWDGMTGASFWQAYSARHMVSSLYERRRPLYQLLWCLEYAKPTEKHLANTNRLCNELGLPNIEHFQ